MLKAHFYCANCGIEYSGYHAAVALVDCPTCHQPPGSPCKRPSGHDIQDYFPHKNREKLAVERGFLCRNLTPLEKLMHPNRHCHLEQT